MGDEGISTADARRLYDWLGARYDAAEAYEGRAKARARALLGLAPGMRLLHVGTGTGIDHAHLQAAVMPGGSAIGVDLAPAMLRLTHARTGAPLSQADARALPFAGATFDALFSAYVLDLLPTADLSLALAEFRRVLRPGRCAALVSLTAGVTPASRLLITAWKSIYRASPLLCGGCRPLALAPLAERAGFTVARREVVVQLGVPSEVLIVE
jgi:ubiquinone/menaquinone biosynthesis C-methylase UbiE